MGSATVTFQDGMKVTAKYNAFLAQHEKSNLRERNDNVKAAYS